MKCYKEGLCVRWGDRDNEAKVFLPLFFKVDVVGCLLKDSTVDNKRQQVQVPM